MKCKIQMVLLFFLLGFLFIHGATNKAVLITTQVGHRIPFPTSDPIDKIPLLGIGFEIDLTNNIGIGGTFIFHQWSDYLRQLGGKYTFREYKPSLDFYYHFNLSQTKAMDLFSGISFGYHFISVENELGNKYDGELENQCSISPFMGIHLYPFSNQSSFLKNLSATFRIHWTVLGDFSGLTLSAGTSFKIK